ARGDFGGLFGPPRNDRGDFHPVDVLQAVEVLFAERAGAGQGNTHRCLPSPGIMSGEGRGEGRSRRRPIACVVEGPPPRGTLPLAGGRQQDQTVTCSRTLGGWAPMPSGWRISAPSAVFDAGIW